jgi:DNA-binding transcriptional ArsR family regulator
MAGMLDLEVIDDPAAAVVALDPLRARLLAGLAEPASASALAERFALPRQKVSYHLRILEEHGLVAEVGQRRWGGLTERVLHATAAAYVVSPGALGEAAGDPDRIADRLSARYLIALAARAVREVAGLARRADQAGGRLPTLALDTEVRFRSAAERAAFTSDLATAVTTLVARYHDAGAPGGRSHRLVMMAHPLPGGPRPDTEEAP